MDVVSTCPLRVVSIVWRPRAAAWALTIVCKATFRLEPGVCVLAEIQEEPADGDVYWDDDPERSVRAADDLAPVKSRADVLLVGHAFAPGGQPTRVLSARMVVGEIDKSVEVWCDRIFWQDGQVLEGQPFARMKLCYERAAFGPTNPVGARFDAPPDAHGAVRLPNLQPPRLRVARRGDTFGPIGFGPIAPGWRARAEKLRQHAAEWSARAWREQPLPGDIDAGYFNAAPFDQQVDAIEGDQRIVLENLHAEHARLETRLPGLRPTALMVAGGRAGEAITLAADTLCIDTDRNLVTVVWRGRVPLGRPDEEGRVVVSMEAARGGASEGTVLFGSEGYAGATVDLGFGGRERGAVTPFSEASGEIGTMLGVRGGGPVLPFGSAKSPWAGFQSRKAGSEQAPTPVDTGTIYGARAPKPGVLPIEWVAPQTRPERVTVAEAVVSVEEASQVAAEPAAEEAPAKAPAPQTEVSIEQCAAMAASIDRRKAETATLLDANGLDPAAWAATKQRWSEAIHKETARGKMGLLQDYDRAYVARLEEERGLIQVEEYARLVVAAERGILAETLAEMTLPQEAIIRIERLWLGKIMENAGLARIVRGALSAERSR